MYTPFHMEGTAIVDNTVVNSRAHSATITLQQKDAAAGMLPPREVWLCSA